MDQTFVSEELLDRESDLIYRIGHAEKEYFIYILLEFQSHPDKAIPVRMFSYILLLYEMIYKNSKKGLLPNIFPMVLYKGKSEVARVLMKKGLSFDLIAEATRLSFEELAELLKENKSPPSAAVFLAQAEKMVIFIN